jgi:hypothetical protein
MSIGGVICKAMVDNGNLWKNVLSLDFLHQLGLTHDDLGYKNLALLGMALD